MTDLIALHHEYEDRMLKGEALFEEIEADIDAHDDLDPDERAALWLCSWAQIPVARQQQKAMQFGPGHGGPPHGGRWLGAALTAVMEVVRDHLEATKRAYGRPRSLDLRLDRRIRQVLGLGRDR